MLMHIVVIMLERKMDSQSGHAEIPQVGGTIPVINISNPDDVHWVEKKQALCLVEAPNTDWRHAHVYFMEQATKWQNKLREVSRMRIEKHLDYMKGK
jgi:cytochrome c oxidase assembly factor CtaG